MTLFSSILRNLEGPFELHKSELQTWWHHWEVRGLLIIIILVQLILLLFGSLRKFKYYRLRGPFFVRPLVWGAYLISEWAPGFTLGVISNMLGNILHYHSFDMGNPYLLTLWATLILMHLGGPDNITAYSLEDNELWRRSLVLLVAQTSFTAYIIVLPGIGIVSPLNILILVLGFIKYGERIWSLYSASTKLRSSSTKLRSSSIRRDIGQNTSSVPEHMLRRFKFLFISFFADVVLTTGLIEEDRLYFEEIGSEKAFREVKKELGLAYDVFYTKALVRYTIWGSTLAFINFFGVVVLFVYSIGILVTGSCLEVVDTCSLAVVDRILTLLLSIVALLSATASLWFCTELLDLRRETSLFVQYDFVALCRKNKSSRPGNLDISFSFLKSDYYLQTESPDLRKMIFNNIKGKSEKHISSNMANFRDYVSAYNHGEFKWASELEFQRSIILWHIATNICYYCDDNSDDEENARYARGSKDVSDYMFYLLLECRYMLPVGLGLVTLQDTYVEAIRFLKTEKVLESDVGEAYKRLLQFQPQEGVQDICSRSLLSNACRLAKELLAHPRNQMWQFLADLWVDILGYAAAKCSANDHAQQLRRGCELLSQVWLLQAHFGVLEQFGVTEMQQDAQNEAHQVINFHQETLAGKSECVVDMEIEEAPQGITESHQETSVPDQSPDLSQSTIPSLGEVHETQMEVITQPTSSSKEKWPRERDKGLAPLDLDLPP